jgi:pimeloyl-ACP methyl ester carboxylesterase
MAAQHAILQSLDDSSRVLTFPCAQGSLYIRRWAKESAERVVLLHGGSGSWRHWVKNIPVLAEHYDVYAVDLPGLGDSAMCEIESDAASAADVTANALESMLEDSFHIVAFSWGCTVTAMIMNRLAERLQSVMLTGPAAVGDLPRRMQMKPLIRRTQEMSRKEILAAQRENLARLMIHNRDLIDDLAVEIQEVNTSKARFSSPQYARSTLLIDNVRGTSTPLYVIYGEYDAPAYPDLEARQRVFREARPDADFELVGGAGHWLQYEQPDLFNSRCLRWLARHSKE